MASDASWVLLAHILRPQGRKGEVLADLFTDFPERFTEHPQVWLAPSGFAEDASASATPQPSEVTAHWLPTGRNAGRIVLHLAGITSINEAEALAGKEVVVPASERTPLEPGAVYISDILGATVFDHDTPIGTVQDMEFPTTPDGLRRLEDAAPLLSVLSPSGDEILIPFASSYIVEVDLPNRAVRMNLPEGLTDINRAPER